MNIVTNGLKLFKRISKDNTVLNFYSSFGVKHPCHRFLLFSFQCNLSNTNRTLANFHGRNPRTPDLIYVPHVLRWLKTKFRFKYLQKTWDPNFSEGAFIYGTTRAVCRITEIIHDDKPEQLQGLLTNSARIKLMDDMTSRITNLQRKIIQLKPDDIKILVPISVNLKTEGAMKKCEVSLRSLALKWFEENRALRLVLVALQTEFCRDYTEGAEPEWIISIFDILECAMLSESPVAH